MKDFSSVGCLWVAFMLYGGICVGGPILWFTLLPITAKLLEEIVYEVYYRKYANKFWKEKCEKDAKNSPIHCKRMEVYNRLKYKMPDDEIYKRMDEVGVCDPDWSILQESPFERAKKKAKNKGILFTLVYVILYGAVMLGYMWFGYWNGFWTPPYKP